MDERHNYIKKLKKMQLDGKLPIEIGVTHVSIFHDNWCAIYSGGFCNCDPDIRVVPYRIEQKAKNERN